MSLNYTDRQMSKKSLLVLSLLIGSAVMGGCNPFEQRVCTQIGCGSGLTVELLGAPAATYTVTATAANGETRSIVCSDQTACRLFFEDFTPSQVTITYESEEQTVEQAFSPEYTRSRPNGDDCPPECLNATVVVDLSR